MREASQGYLLANVEAFNGLAQVYESYNPSVPLIILELLTHIVQMPYLHLVVDLGSGTGNSTNIWSDRAQRVIGIEPNHELRLYAQNNIAILNREGIVSYQYGFSHDTHLSDNCADIVTCSQSLHWMEPQATFTEVNRILRPGGVFAAYQFDKIPIMNWEASLAYSNFLEGIRPFENNFSLQSGSRKWPKNQHLSEMQKSGYFRFLTKTAFHQVELGNAERLVGLASSKIPVSILLKQGISEQELGLDKLRCVAQQTLGNELKPWYFSYQMEIGIK